MAVQRREGREDMWLKRVGRMNRENIVEWRGDGKEQIVLKREDKREKKCGEGWGEGREQK